MARLTALILTLGLCSLSLAACGGSGPDTPAAEADVSYATSAAPASTPVVEPTPAATPAPPPPGSAGFIATPAAAATSVPRPITPDVVLTPALIVVTPGGSGGQFQVTTPGGSGPAGATGVQATFVGADLTALAQFLGVSKGNWRPI